MTTLTVEAAILDELAECATALGYCRKDEYAAVIRQQTDDLLDTLLALRRGERP